MTRLLTSIKAGPVGWVPKAHAHPERKRRDHHPINQPRKGEKGERERERKKMDETGKSREKDF